MMMMMMTYRLGKSGGCEELVVPEAAQGEAVQVNIIIIIMLFRSARTSWNTFVSSSVRSSVGKKNLDQLYSSALYMLHRPI